MGVLFLISAYYCSSSLSSRCRRSGIASVYSDEKTANGEYAHATAFTAAHRTLPFGTFVEVTNLKTGRSVIVRINDRGPFIAGRIIDLTPAGAKAIGSDGLAPVALTVLGTIARRAGRPDKRLIRFREAVETQRNKSPRRWQGLAYTTVPGLRADRSAAAPRGTARRPDG